VQCKALFGVPTLRSSDYASILAAALPSLASSRPHELHDEAVPTLRSVVLADNVSTKQSGAFQQVLDGCSGFADYADVASSSSQCPFAEPDLRNDETINLQFTSGTTGHPKAVRLSHKNLLNNGARASQSESCAERGKGAHIGARMRISNQDVLLNSARALARLALHSVFASSASLPLLWYCGFATPPASFPS
jgi:long-subunit acyl-CoA synthetase (AMP-forming)